MASLVLAAGFAGLVPAAGRAELAVPPPVTGAPADPLDRKLAIAGFVRGAPILIRTFKTEARLEVWLMRAGRFALFETYPICNWDGRLGPKIREGDRQSPEGFYTVGESQLRWTGRWHRGFDLGFPNAYDLAQGRSGSGLLIHGACTSIGCYAMTDPVIDELFDLAAAALANGQPRFAVHAFPFALGEAAIASRTDSPWQSFWRDLAPAAGLLEATGVPPRIAFCGARYLVTPGQPGSDGSEPLRYGCATPLAAGGPPAAEPDASPSPPPADSARAAPAPSPRLLAYVRAVAEGRKPAIVWPRPAARTRKGVASASFDPGPEGEAVTGPALQVRCNRGLASCRKWIALHYAKQGRPVAGDPGRAKRVRLAKAKAGKARKKA